FPRRTSRRIPRSACAGPSASGAGGRPTVLDYTITPNAVPRTVSPAEPSMVTLMITVTNKTGAAVPVQRLTFTIQAGDSPANLTDTDHLAPITAAVGSGTPWEIFPATDG